LARVDHVHVKVFSTDSISDRLRRYSIRAQAIAGYGGAGWAIRLPRVCYPVKLPCTEQDLRMMLDLTAPLLEHTCPPAGRVMPSSISRPSRSGRAELRFRGAVTAARPDADERFVLFAVLRRQK
jgi:hypothetical protein